MDRQYSTCFGFTQDEVRQMMACYGIIDKENELKDWYDGYVFGDTGVYNPWSVINYIAKGCTAQAYWVNTGKNEILDDILKTADDNVTEKLYGLLEERKVIAHIDQNMAYSPLRINSSSIYSLLLVAGYLKPVSKALMADGSYMCEVAIPNREIRSVYSSEILSHLPGIGAISGTTAERIEPVARQ